MSTTVTNRKASQAYRGESVIVTLNAADHAVLSTLVLGTVCTCNQSSKTGTISFIDKYGLSFKITPISPDKRFDGATKGILSVSDTITF